MVGFNILTLEDICSWNRYLSLFPKKMFDIYFTPEYYKIYEENKEGRANCFVFEENKNIALYPFLLNSVNDLGYKLDRAFYDIQGAYGYNGVISTSHDPDFIRAFYKSFNRYCMDNNIIAEFTRFHPILHTNNFSKKNLSITYDRETVFLDLTKEYGNIWNNEYSGNNRNMIRKAEKYGVKSGISENEEDYRCFIDQYAETMRNVNASDYYFFNEAYFINIRNQLKDNQYLFVSKIKNECVGAMIIFLKGIYAHYHLSARKKEFGKYAISNHLLDSAIKFAQKKGCEVFHFGGGVGSNENDPLLKFKMNFSTQKGEFYFGKKIHNKIYYEVVKQWEMMFPEKKEKYKNFLLKYRF